MNISFPRSLLSSIPKYRIVLDGVACRVMGVLLFGFAFWVAPANAVHSGQAGHSITLGVYIYTRSTEMIKKMRPLRQYFNRVLAERGLPYRVRLKIYPSYGEAIDALAAGEVDFARFGPVSYVLAKRRNPALRLIAMESNHGSKRFNGVIAVSQDSSIRDIADLRGKRIAFGDRRSTTSRYLAQALLVQNGLEAADFSGLSYLDRHDKVAYALASGNYDVGAMNENTFNKYAQSKGLRKVAEFPSVTKPWIAREGLDEELFLALRDSLFELKDKSILQNIKRTGFLPAQDSDYDLIRQGMEQASSFDRQQLLFSTYPSEMPSVVYTWLMPLLSALESTLEAAGHYVLFKPKAFPNYAASVDALVRGEIDLGRYGPVSYILAKKANKEIRILAREQHDEAPSGVLFVRSDAPIRTLADIRHKRVVFADRYSTEGRYLAQAALVRAGIAANGLLHVAYLGRHDRVVFSVAAGNYDVGAAGVDTFEKYREAKKLRVIHQYPSREKSWVVRSGLDSSLFQALQQALLVLEIPDVSRRLDLVGFTPANDEYYDGVRTAMEAVDTFWPAK